jgi:hypothetical protein
VKDTGCYLILQETCADCPQICHEELVVGDLPYYPSQLLFLAGTPKQTRNFKRFSFDKSFHGKNTPQSSQKDSQVPGSVVAPQAISLLKECLRNTMVGRSHL